MRQFLLGTALLNMGEEEKALDLFISAAAGVPQVLILFINHMDQGEALVFGPRVVCLVVLNC